MKGTGDMLRLLITALTGGFPVKLAWRLQLALACACCWAGRGGDEGPRASDTGVLRALVASLASTDEQARAQATRRVVALGAQAIPELVTLMRTDLPKERDSLWREAYLAIEAIADAHRADPELDVSLQAMPRPETKNAVFAGMDFVWIPPGWFVAGTRLSPGQLAKHYWCRGQRDYDDPPVTEVRRLYLDGYWIGRTEVTAGDFRRLGIVPEWLTADVAANTVLGALPANPDRFREALLRSTADFDAFCAALTRSVVTMGLVAGLPSNDQWEKAARGTDGRLYPWGNSPAHVEETIPSRPDEPWPWAPQAAGTTPIDTSPYGVKDMLGNVSEFVVNQSVPYVPGQSLEGLKRAHPQRSVLRRRGIGYNLQEICTKMLPFPTQAGPTGLRIVLVPATGPAAADPAIKATPMAPATPAGTSAAPK